MKYGFLIDSYDTERLNAYSSLEALLEGEGRGGAKSVLPVSTGIAVTERPTG